MAAALTSLERVLALARTAGSQPLALATVVHVRGSAYRRPGARLLVTSDGRSAGLISGGCLEEDVKVRAGKVLRSGQPGLVTYDSTSPDDLVFGLGLGCNGIVSILIEPARASEGILSFFEACVALRKPARIATVFESDGLRIGARWMDWPDGGGTGEGADASTLDSLRDLCRAGLRRSSVEDLVHPDGRWARVFVETIAPPPALVVFGAGDDAIPLVHGAKDLGWSVTVVDHRPALASRERFPEADAIHCLRPEALSDRPDLVPAEALVMVMTHRFEHDRVLVSTLLGRPLRYLGVLGPAARTHRLLEGRSLPPSSVLRGPAGLDLGAESPEEIALSILAEMQAVLTHRPATSLRSRPGPIHETVLA